MENFVSFRKLENENLKREEVWYSYYLLDITVQWMRESQIRLTLSLSHKAHWWALNLLTLQIVKWKLNKEWRAKNTDVKSCCGKAEWDWRALKFHKKCCCFNTPWDVLSRYYPAECPGNLDYIKPANMFLKEDLFISSVSMNAHSPNDG